MTHRGIMITYVITNGGGKVLCNEVSMAHVTMTKMVITKMMESTTSFDGPKEYTKEKNKLNIQLRLDIKKEKSSL